MSEKTKLPAPPSPGEHNGEWAGDRDVVWEWREDGQRFEVAATSPSVDHDEVAKIVRAFLRLGCKVEVRPIKAGRWHLLDHRRLGSQD